MAVFRKQRALNLVWYSNQLEGTLPNEISQQQTFQLLDSLYADAYDTHAAPADSPQSQSAEGGSGEETTVTRNGAADLHSEGAAEEAVVLENGTDAEKDRLGRRQLLQHMRAYLHCQRAAYANVQKPLTETFIQELHRCLMQGLVTEDGTPINAGTYREMHVHAGVHTFPPPEYVPKTMSEIVQEYNQKSAEEHDPYKLASWLLYRVVTIHPFQDGNGRLCRLLASYSLMRDGLPFPVSISSGRKKAHKHYVDAIVRDRRARVGQPHLTTLTVFSVQRGWNNFYSNEQYNPKLSIKELFD